MLFFIFTPAIYYLIIIDTNLVIDIYFCQIVIYSSIEKFMHLRIVYLYICIIKYLYHYIMKEYDVGIIGAGPAGTSAALNLAESGLKIAILDKSSFPRDKVCGDALSGSVLHTLRKFPGNIANEFQRFEPKLKSTGVRFFSPNNTRLDLPLCQTGNSDIVNPGFLCRRIDFDNFLFMQLKNSQNMDIHQDFKVEKVFLENDKVVIQSAEKTITANVVIGADGTNSIVARRFTNKKIDNQHKVSSVMAYFENVSGFHEENFIELHFIKDLLPGYFWMFPMKNDMANVGLGTLSSKVIKDKIKLKEVFNEVITNHPTISPRFKSAVQVSELKGGVIPLGSAKQQISGERFILCGDAAGLVNPFTSEGISYAMRSGMIAADHIKKCFLKNEFSAEFMKGYDLEIDKRFYGEFSINHRIQRLSRHAWLFNFIVKKVNRKPELKELFIRMFNDMDVRSLLTKPSFYFKLLFK